MDDKSARLDAASNPRQATLGDAPRLARMFAAAFSDDPLFDYMVRPGVKRRAALELFFHDILSARDIPQGEVWMSADAHACVSWLPPGGRRSLEGFVERLRWLPFMLNVFGFSRLGRFMAVSDAMDKNHPLEQHFYLTFIAVSPQYRGTGMGSRILKATLDRIDRASGAAYVENSNPDHNTRFYEQAGFVTRKDVAPAGAPPLIAMWRAAR
jgi:ribosomal protein S18 acetylase RimI-like enzyme